MQLIVAEVQKFLHRYALETGDEVTALQAFMEK